jgi:hypothetical protein
MEVSQQIIQSVKLPERLNRSNLPEFMKQTLKASISQVKQENS